MKVVHGPDVEFKLVHGSDEKSYDLSNQLAGIALVIFYCDRSVLLNPVT